MRRSEDVLLTGTYQPRYIDRLRAWGDRLRDAGCSVTEGYYDTWYAEDVLAALAQPRDLVVYFGHGVPGAWKGYGHVDATDIGALTSDAPNRLVASLCCESLVVDPAREMAVGSALRDAGLAERVLGYDCRVRHEANRQTLDRLLSAYEKAVESDSSGVEAVVRAVENEPTLRVVGAVGENGAH